MDFSKLEKTLDYLFPALALALIFLNIDVSLVFLKTHVAGGDMISHPWIYKSLKHNILSGKIWSWNQGWGAGLPFLYYYFYPIYLMAIFFEFIGFDHRVAFKLVPLLIVILTPLVFYFYSRKWLKPIQACCLTSIALFLFFNEFYSFWGGNLKSLLAGQMSHQLGILFLFAYISEVLATNKISALLLSGCVLLHVYTGLYAVLFTLIFYTVNLNLVNKKNIQNTLLAIGLSAFHWIPFLYYRSYTITPPNVSKVNLQEIVRVLQLENPLFFCLYFLSVCTIFLSKASKKTTISFLILIALSILIMPFTYKTPVLHIRLVPQIYLLVLILLAYQLKELRYFKKTTSIVISLLFLQSIFHSNMLDKILPQQVRQSPKETFNWWQWNMTGIEAKKESHLVFDVWNYLKRNVQENERIVAEYSNDYNKFGSPRIFEMTPYITGKNILENLLLESSTTFPFYFYINQFIRTNSWWPGFKRPKQEINIKKGLELYSLYNVKYYIAYSNDVKNFLKTQMTPVHENRSFSIFKINQTSEIASIINLEIPMIKTKNALQYAVENFAEMMNHRIEIAYGNSEVEQSHPQSMEQPILIPLKGNWNKDMDQYVVHSTGASTEAPKRILFKIPYFPNWKTNTDEKIYLTSPNLMSVVTTHSQIKLQYQTGIPEKLALLISLLSGIFALYSQLTRFKKILSL
jgi:hypothetical protein